MADKRPPNKGEKPIKHDQNKTTKNKELYDALEKYKTDAEIGAIVKSLQSGLNKNDAKEIKTYSSILIGKSCDPKHTKSKLNHEDYMLVLEMCEKDKVQQQVKLEKENTPVTAGQGTTEVTDVDFGSAKKPSTSDILPADNTSANSDQAADILKKDQISKGKEDEIEELKQKMAEKRERETLFEQNEKEFKRKKEEMEQEINELRRQLGEERERQKLFEENEKELKRIKEQAIEKKQENDNLKTNIKLLCEEKEQECKRLNDEHKGQIETICHEYNRQLKVLEKNHNQEMQEKKAQLSEIKKERDDMKTRFSKLAGEKLTDQNADIADLSDPLRAMKLSEKFGALYDDEWTDAFLYLKKKMPVKDAITLLIQILKDCLVYCASISDGQINGLKNVLLHPFQDILAHATNTSKPKKGIKEVSRIGSKDEGAVYEVRRKIGVTECVVSEVVQGFIQETKSWGEKGFDKQHLKKCAPYIEKCAEICWLMTIHCPPLYIKLDVQHGDKLDSNFFSNYKIQSKEIDYLVWPPLFNEKNGGLLKKGVAEGIDAGS